MKTLHKSSASPKGSAKVLPLLTRRVAPRIRENPTQGQLNFTVAVTLEKSQFDSITKLIEECRKAHSARSYTIRTPAEFIARAAVKAADDLRAGLDHEYSAGQFAQLIYELREDLFQAIFDICGDNNRRARLATALQDAESYLRDTGKPVDRGETQVENFAREMMDASTLGLCQSSK